MKVWQGNEEWECREQSFNSTEVASKGERAEPRNVGPGAVGGAGHVAGGTP